MILDTEFKDNLSPFKFDHKYLSYDQPSNLDKINYYHYIDLRHYFQMYLVLTQ